VRCEPGPLQHLSRWFDSLPELSQPFSRGTWRYNMGSLFMRELVLYEDYSRKEVHDLFEPESPFTPQTGCMSPKSHWLEFPSKSLRPVDITAG